MNIQEKVQVVQQISVLEAELARRANYKIKKYYQDTGPLRRELYQSALRFFKAGKDYPERLIMGGNRTGKTEAAAYEITLHLTGEYPDWWEGRRFDHPVDIWIVGDTASTTRDICQMSLYGPIPAAPRTGMIPAHRIVHATPKNSIPGATETIFVRHKSGGQSSAQFKSYDQRREAFQGTAKHVVWLDEECPEDVYTECLLRTLTVEGIVMVTFTPVEGLTPFVQLWLETSVIQDSTGEIAPAESAVFAAEEDSSDVVAEEKEEVIDLKDRKRIITMVSWDEVPHLSDTAKAQMLASIPPYQRAARTRGIPNLGSGVIYPIPEEEIKVKPFEIPAHWKRGYGMDVGWNWTVALFGAYDHETDTIYFYHEHYRSHAEPPVHAEGIKAAGSWIYGRIDPGANGRNQLDGRQLLQVYKDLGLHLDMAPNGVEAGIHDVWTKLTAGKIKVFSNLRHFFTEYRMYRRDAKGRVVKKADHLMDSMRYYVASGIDWLVYNPVTIRTPRGQDIDLGGQGWMG